MHAISAEHITKAYTSVNADPAEISAMLPGQTARRSCVRLTFQNELAVKMIHFLLVQSPRTSCQSTKVVIDPENAAGLLELLCAVAGKMLCLRTGCHM